MKSAERGSRATLRARARSRTHAELECVTGMHYHHPCSPVPPDPPPPSRPPPPVCFNYGHPSRLARLARIRARLFLLIILIAHVYGTGSRRARDVIITEIDIIYECNVRCCFLP